MRHMLEHRVHCVSEEFKVRLTLIHCELRSVVAREEDVLLLAEVIHKSDLPIKLRHPFSYACFAFYRTDLIIRCLRHCW